MHRNSQVATYGVKIDSGNDAYLLILYTQKKKIRVSLLFMEWFTTSTHSLGHNKQQASFSKEEPAISFLAFRDNEDIKTLSLQRHNSSVHLKELKLVY